MKAKPGEPTREMVAREHFRIRFQDRTFKELASIFVGKGYQVTEARLGKMIREMEEQGRIHRFVLGAKEDLLPRDFDLESDVSRRFRLRQVMVVDTSYVAPPTAPMDQDESAWDRYDDAIHERLGAWGGRLLASHLRPSDVIGLGGGRGPAYTVAKCDVAYRATYTGDIYALTGRIGTGPWSEDTTVQGDGDPVLDADFIASRLQGKLSTKGDVYPVKSDITGRRWACSRKAREQPLVAVVGIGALGGGHRLVHFADFNGVAGVKNILERIKSCSEKLEQGTQKCPPFLHPVGDVCNWYFVVEDFVPNDDVGRLKQLKSDIQDLNKHFLNTSPDTLKGIARRGMVVAVAGGPHKHAAMWYVLNKNRDGEDVRWITHLVTDVDTAVWLVEKDKQRVANPNIKLNARPKMDRAPRTKNKE